MVTKRKLSWSTRNIAASAFRFLYHVTLGRDAVEFEVPVVKQSQRLPEILSRDEVSRLLDDRDLSYLLATQANAVTLWSAQLELN